jgi:hypothetical protein
MKLFSIFLIISIMSSLAFAEPVRDMGISVYLNPEGVVKKANKENIQRFLVTDADRKSVVAWDSTATGLIEKIKNQPAGMQENGIWLVYSNPDAYTDLDRSEQNKLKDLAKENGIPFFEARASELPNGWRRIN